MNSDPTRIAIAVVEHHGRFLVGRRRQEQVLGGLWEFPGGKVKADESLPQAAVRECREETGLQVRVVGQYGSQRQTYRHGLLLLQFFQCQLQPEPAAADPPVMHVNAHSANHNMRGNADEASRTSSALPAPKPPFCWVAREQLSQLEFPAGNRSLLQLLLSRSHPERVKRPGVGRDAP